MTESMPVIEERKSKNMLWVEKRISKEGMQVGNPNTHLCEQKAFSLREKSPKATSLNKSFLEVQINFGKACLECKSSQRYPFKWDA